MKLDFSDIKETKICTEGEHSLTIVKAEEKKSQNGLPMLVLDLNDEEGGYVRDNVMLQGPGAFKAQQLFDALGIDPDTAKEMDAKELQGLVVEAKTAVEEYEGTPRAKVSKYIG